MILDLWTIIINICNFTQNSYLGNLIRQLATSYVIKHCIYSINWYGQSLFE